MTRGTSSERANREFYGEMAAWLREQGEDNEGDILRLKRNLRIVREAELTPRQRQLLEMRFEQNMSNIDIAQALGLDRSTVSRTLTRARRRVYRFLRYGL